jgi:D-3-phosphoglycerate dehydrogenase
MSPSTPIQVWLEAPLFPHILAMLPDDVQVISAALPPAHPCANARDAEVFIASSLVRYTGEVMDACPDLRLIARTGIGVDNVDVEAATERGVVVTNTPDGPTESTAEHTVAILLALAKRLKVGAENLAAGKWGPRSGLLIGDEVQGKTLGLIGLGRIGRRVAQICRLAFEMRVLAYDPYVTSEQAAALGVELAEMERVISQADFLSLHVPATPETIRIMDRTRIASMKRGAYLLNLARGPLVDEGALLAALDSGQLAGAGVDVFDPEPPDATSRLRNHPLVVATPHIASLTKEGRERMERMAMERVLAFLAGEKPVDIVNPAVWERRRRHDDHKGEST